MTAGLAAAEIIQLAAKMAPEAIVGKGSLTAGMKDGVKMDKPEGEVTVTKDKITFKGSDGMVFEFGYTLDVKAIPAAIDMEILAPEGFKGAKAKGIIAVEKDVVKLAYHPMNGYWPKDFAAKKGSGEHAFEWKKAEKSSWPTGSVSDRVPPPDRSRSRFAR